MEYLTDDSTPVMKQIGFDIAIGGYNQDMAR
jgi:hypothetical protein